MRAKSTEIATVLGLEDSASVTLLQLATHCEKGLPTSCCSELARILGPEGQQFLNLLISPAARRRGTQGRLSAWDSDCLVRIADCWLNAMMTFQDKGKTRRFLMGPHALLAGQPPIQVAAMNICGATAVDQILGRLLYGSAA